jgi:Mycothiol maleylpyruvate isomerase N-terminal domain
VSAAAYFHVLGVSADLTSPANEAIRARGAASASGGPAVVAAAAAAAHARLADVLEALGATRKVRVVGGVVITLDAYLRTRIVEIVVHADDLATSVGLATPPFTAETTSIAIDTLVGLARFRHGDAAVLRALARRERDAVAALRVL